MLTRVSEAARAAEAAEDHRRRCADGRRCRRGRADPLAVKADMTVTFGYAKVGLHALPGSEYAGQVQVVDIGIPKAAEGDITVELISTPWVRERLAGRPKSGNKGTFGKALVVGGSAE